MIKLCVVVDSYCFDFFFLGFCHECELKMMKISKVEYEEKISCCWCTLSYNRHAKFNCHFKKKTYQMI